MTEEIEKPIPKRAQDLYEKGEQALDSSNYDYAIALFEGALDCAPTFSACRRKLRLAEFRKFDLERPSIAGVYVKLLLNLKPLLNGYFHFSKGHWMEALSEFEKVLKIHPKNKIILAKMAVAAENNEMIDIALDFLNAIRLIDPKNVATIKEMARIYKDTGRLDEARQCYEDVLNISAHDPDAGPELRKIAAIGTIKLGAWDRIESFREKIKDEEQAKLFEKEAKITRTESEIKDLILSQERKLALSPENFPLLRSLSELYFQLHDFDKAVELMKKCIAVNPSDLSLKRSLAQIEFRIIERGINKTKELLFDSPNDEKLKSSLRELEHKKKHLRLADCIARVEQYPTNLMLRFELGNIYVENDMIDKAISEFQLSVKTPSKKIQSLNCLGICFKTKKLYDLAVEQFTTAAEYLREMTPLKKEITYNLASTYEAMGSIEKAVTEYKKIYSIDIAYKDVAEKIEKIYRNKLK